MYISLVIDGNNLLLNTTIQMEGSSWVISVYWYRFVTYLSYIAAIAAWVASCTTLNDVYIRIYYKLRYIEYNLPCSYHGNGTQNYFNNLEFESKYRIIVHVFIAI